MKTVRLGLIGGGMMGKEVASALARWFMLKDFPVQVILTAVCTARSSSLEWFRSIPTVQLFTTNYKELLASDTVDVVYIAVPHHLHKTIYTDTLLAGKDLLGEKPFGMDLPAALSLQTLAQKTKCFVRCTSEFPYYPAAHRLYEYVQKNTLGSIIEVKAGFLHASDLNPNKPINWKRQAKYCGEIGVMGDLGLHVLHLPFRLGWFPSSVYATLQKIIEQRPDGKGGSAIVDTWNNATLMTQFITNNQVVPMTLELKRMAPGHINTWYIEIWGTESAIRYSTQSPKSLQILDSNTNGTWLQIDIGLEMAFPVSSGAIFEAGFTDAFMQMLAAYFAEREGILGNKLGCLTVDEVVKGHQLFEGALRSHLSNQSVAL